MRRIFSYFFAVLVLFNVLGYYGLFLGLEYQNTRKMTQRFDSNSYQDSETITLKVPLAVPYGTDSKDFERVDGTFTHEGQVYRMVKQKLSQDTLYVVVVNDNTSKHINEAFTDYVKTFADNPTDSKSSSKLSFNFIKEYVVHDLSIAHPSYGWQREVAPMSTHSIFIDSFNSSIIHPPERA